MPAAGTGGNTANELYGADGKLIGIINPVTGAVDPVGQIGYLQPPLLTRTDDAANTAARQVTANAYYRTLGWEDVRIASHTSGIDFSKPVEVVTLPKGTQVVQYQIPGNPVGGYFAPVGTTAESLGISFVGRQPIIYTTTEGYIRSPLYGS